MTRLGAMRGESRGWGRVLEREGEGAWDLWLRPLGGLQ